MSPVVLVSGFEAFGGHAHNPTERLVSALETDAVPGARLAGVVLPVSYGRAPKALLAEVARRRPAAVVCCGLDARASAIAIERIGVNLQDATRERPDNDGEAPRDEPVVLGGPDGLFTTLPNRAVLDELGAAGVPTVLSGSAGTFVCNAVLYRLLHHLRAGAGEGVQPPVAAGFLHFPRTPDLGGSGSPLDFEVMRRGLHAALRAVAARLPFGSSAAGDAVPT